MPKAADFPQKNSAGNSLKAKGKLKQSGDNCEYVVKGFGLVSTSDRT